MTPAPPIPTLFPYTTLFRSDPDPAALPGAREERAARCVQLPRRRLRGKVDRGGRRGHRRGRPRPSALGDERSEEHTSELQSRRELVCRLLLEKKKEYRLSLR